MAFKINEDEWNALHDEPLILFKLYCAIRRCMDYKTCIAGTETRINERYFHEVLGYSARPGRKKSGPLTQKQIRWYLFCLEKLGLIESLGNYVFKCLLADAQESNQKIKGVNRAYSRAQGRAQPDNKKTSENQASNSLSHDEVGREAGSDTPSRKGVPQESGIYKNKKLSPLPPHFEVTDTHRDYATRHQLPSPDSELEGFKDHHLAKGSTFSNWDAAFRNWLRKGKQIQQEKKERTHAKSSIHKPAFKKKPQSKTELLYNLCAPGAFGTDEDDEKNNPED